MKRVKKSKNSTDAVALALAGGGFLAHSDLERNGFFSVFSCFFNGLVCQQVGFLKMELKGKKAILLNFTSAKWVVASACNEGTLSGIFVGLATLIDLQDLSHNTKHINNQCLTCMASVMICCPILHILPTALLLVAVHLLHHMKTTTGAPEKCGGHCDCQCGWMVCGSIGILCQLSAA